MQQLSLPASVFCLASPSDAALLAEWESHLLPLQQAGHITIWSEQRVQLGTVPRMQQIHDHLDHADLVVLAISAAFFANDECIGLMERAIERAKRNEVRLIPLLLRPVAWRESPLAPFSCMPSDNRPVTEWSNRDAAFEACVRDIRHLLGRPITASLSHHHTHTEAYQNRMRMLRRVRAIWIDGLLAQSLHDAVRIELHLQDRPDVLENPLRLQVQELDQAPKTLPDGTTIVHVYDRDEGELLILGEPGSGKTTLLLELAATLLERAEKHEQIPIPVIFNLSSWAEKREPLHKWLIEELRKIYQVPRKTGKAWIDADCVLPLLDGLDEVAKDARSACVEQINVYYQSRLERGNSPIVVCCRSEEYAAISTRVMLQHAVSILPLTDSQINTYLGQAGEQVTGLRQSLSEDAELHNLARQPLMLNIFTLAYQGVQASDVPTGEACEGTQHIIFARYVERMLKRREQLKRWKSEQVTRWLTFLAKQMQQHDQTVFSVENLQPIWLSRRWRLLYQWCVRLVFGVVFGLFFGLASGGTVFGIILFIVFNWLFIPISVSIHGQGFWAIGVLDPISVGLGLVFGLILGGDGQIRPAEVLTWSWKKARSGLINGFIIGLISQRIFLGLDIAEIFFLIPGLVLGLPIRLVRRRLSGGRQRERQRLFFSHNESIWHTGKKGLVLGLILGVILSIGSLMWLVLGLVFGLVLKRDTGRKLSEIFTGSWEKARPGLIGGLILGLIIGQNILWVIGLIIIPISEQVSVPISEQILSPILLLIYQLVFALVFGLLIGLVRGPSGKQLPERLSLSPNEGIWRSGKKGLFFGLAFGLFNGSTWPVFLLVFGSFSSLGRLVSVLVFGLFSGLGFGVFFGLGAFVKHFLLRFFLSLQGNLPCNLVPFLDESAERLFLHKVGGSYIFVHRQLLDYFASLDEPRLRSVE